MASETPPRGPRVAAGAGPRPVGRRLGFAVVTSSARRVQSYTFITPCVHLSLVHPFAQFCSWCSQRSSVAAVIPLEGQEHRHRAAQCLAHRAR